MRPLPGIMLYAYNRPGAAGRDGYSIPIGNGSSDPAECPVFGEQIDPDTESTRPGLGQELPFRVAAEISGEGPFAPVHPSSGGGGSALAG